MVFGAILNNENQKNHEKTAFARGFKTMKKQDLRTQPICPILPGLPDLPDLRVTRDLVRSHTSRAHPKDDGS